MTNDNGLSYIRSKVVLKTQVSGQKRIEDKLMEQGEMTKKRKDKKHLEKIMTENSKYDFKPKTHSSAVNLGNTKYGGHNFIERMNYLNLAKKEKLENLKTQQRIKKYTSDCTFQPKIDEKLKGFKRSYVDLLVNTP